MYVGFNPVPAESIYINKMRVRRLRIHMVSMIQRDKIKKKTKSWQYTRLYIVLVLYAILYLQPIRRCKGSNGYT